MAVTFSPYIHFGGDARAALEHYASVLGGEASIIDYASSGFAETPGFEQVDPSWVFHGELVTGFGPVILAADTGDVADSSRVTVTLVGDAADHDELARVFEALAAGGTVEEPFALAPWGSYFGSFKDRFGVGWFISTNPE